MGSPKPRPVGCGVGCGVGRGVGRGVGGGVGLGVGLLVGGLVGCGVGFFVGDLVGVSVGALVGGGEGESVGLGDFVGALVEAVGLEVGSLTFREAVGATVGFGVSGVSGTVGDVNTAARVSFKDTLAA